MRRLAALAGAGARRWAMLIALGCLAMPVAAQTYKWVDAKGVVTYSNNPPPAGTRNVQTVAERISYYEAEPQLLQRAAARLALREQLAEEEWLQRQRLMALSASYTQDLGYAGHYYGGYYPYGTVLVSRRVRTVRGGRGFHRF